MNERIVEYWKPKSVWMKLIVFEHGYYGIRSDEKIMEYGFEDGGLISLDAVDKYGNEVYLIWNVSRDEVFKGEESAWGIIWDREPSDVVHKEDIKGE